MKRIDTLSAAAIAFVAANLLHTADHLRQGLGDVTGEVQAGGTVLSLLALATLALALRRHPWAPPVAAAVGFAGAAGIAASHLAPHWSALSDSYPEIGVDALSWAVMFGEIGAALILGAVAVRELRREGAPRRPTSAAAAR